MADIRALIASTISDTKSRLDETAAVDPERAPDAAEHHRYGDEPAPHKPDRKPASLAALTMFGLQFKANIYGGTVPEAEVARRRRKNRAARRARRGNTRALARQARLNRDHTPKFRRGQSPYIDGISPPIDAEIVEDES